MSGLGDLLRSHLQPVDSAASPAATTTATSSPSGRQPGAPEQPVQQSAANMVFPERVEKKLQDEDCHSNASSTDDYVRELLDPNDRPRNVWHVVEGPKSSEADADASADLQEAPMENSSQPEEATDAPLRECQSEEAVAQGETNTNSHHPAGLSPGPEEGLGSGESAALDDTEKERLVSKEASEVADKRSPATRARNDRDSDRDRSDRDKDSRRHRHRDDRHRDRSRDRDSRSSRRSGSRHKSSRRSGHDDRSDSEPEYSSSSRRRSDRERRHRSRSKGSSSRRSRERSRSNSQSPLTKRNSKTILIMQLNPKVTSRDLEEFFSELGRVREVRLITDSKTRRHKGIAYIEFEDSATAQKAFAMNGQTFFDAPIVIQSALTGDRASNRSSNDNRHLPSSTSQTTRSSSTSRSNHHSSHHHHHSSSRSHHSSSTYRVYAGGLHVNITEEMLKSLFEPFGPILRLELMRDRVTNASRGYAFITYADIEDGQSAVLALDGLELGGKPIKVSKSTDKNDRQSSSTITDSSTRASIRAAGPATNYDDDDADSQATSKSRDVTASLFELAGH